MQGELHPSTLRSGILVWKLKFRYLITVRGDLKGKMVLYGAKYMIRIIAIRMSTRTKILLNYDNSLSELYNSYTIYSA